MFVVVHESVVEVPARIVPGAAVNETMTGFGGGGGGVTSSDDVTAIEPLVAPLLAALTVTIAGVGMVLGAL